MGSRGWVKGSGAQIPSDLRAGQGRSHRRLHLQEMHCPQASSHPPLQHLQQVGLLSPSAHRSTQGSLQDPSPWPLPCCKTGAPSPLLCWLIASSLAQHGACTGTDAGTALLPPRCVLKMDHHCRILLRY